MPVFRFVAVDSAGLAQHDHPVVADGTDGTGQLGIAVFSAPPPGGGLILGAGIDDVSVDLP